MARPGPPRLAAPAEPTTRAADFSRCGGRWSNTSSCFSRCGPWSWFANGSCVANQSKRVECWRHFVLCKTHGLRRAPSLGDFSKEWAQLSHAEKREYTVPRENTRPKVTEVGSKAPCPQHEQQTTVVDWAPWQLGSSKRPVAHGLAHEVQRVRLFFRGQSNPSIHPMVLYGLHRKCGWYMVNKMVQYGAVYKLRYLITRRGCPSSLVFGGAGGEFEAGGGGSGGWVGGGSGGWQGAGCA